MSGFFGWLEAEGIIYRNPMEQIHGLRVQAKVKEPYTDEEVERMRDACTCIRDLAIVDMLNSTGMRIGELINLDISDVNMEDFKIYSVTDKYFVPMSSPKDSDYQLAGENKVLKKSIVPIIRMTEKNSSKIENNAKLMYKQKVSNDETAGYVKAALDFAKLEKLCDEYMEIHK